MGSDSPGSLGVETDSDVDDTMNSPQSYTGKGTEFIYPVIIS